MEYLSSTGWKILKQMLKRSENLKVVSNTSPLIYLSKIGRLMLLHDLFGVISIPDAVANEILRGKVHAQYCMESLNETNGTNNL